MDTLLTKRTSLEIGTVSHNHACHTCHSHVYKDEIQPYNQKGRAKKHHFITSFPKSIGHNSNEATTINLTFYASKDSVKAHIKKPAT